MMERCDVGNARTKNYRSQDMDIRVRFDMGLLSSLCYYAMLKIAEANRVMDEKLKEQAEARNREQLKWDSIEVEYKVKEK